MRILGLNISLGLLAMLLVISAGHAQSPDGNSASPVVQPIPFSPLAPLFTEGTNKPRAASESSVSNSPPLAGAQELSVGNPESRRSYWQPFFNLTSSLDTNPLGVGNTFSAVPWGSLYGGVDLNLSSHRSDFSVDYIGGGVLSGYSTEDGPIQQLVLGEKLSLRRAAISLFDQFGYFPEAVSQFNLPTNADLIDNRQTSLQPVFLPNQSIATTLGQQLNNTFVGEVDVNLTRRSSACSVAWGTGTGRTVSIGRSASKKISDILACGKGKTRKSVNAQYAAARRNPHFEGILRPCIFCATNKRKPKSSSFRRLNTRRNLASKRASFPELPHIRESADSRFVKSGNSGGLSLS
jgi:hypothetical protein